VDVASRGRNSVNLGLMPSGRIRTCFDQIFQSVPATGGAVELDHFKPVRSGLNKWLPSLSTERDAFDVAAAPFVNDRHAIPSDRTRIEPGFPMLRTVNQRECQHVGVAD